MAHRSGTVTEVPVTVGDGRRGATRVPAARRGAASRARGGSRVQHAGHAVALVGTCPPTRAADHAESTSVAGDPGADIVDVFAFLDPNDNSKVVLALDVEGFVVPSELLNLSFFAPDVTYRFLIERTGDAVADATIDVTFSPQTSRSQPQTATISCPTGRPSPPPPPCRRWRRRRIPSW